MNDMYYNDYFGSNYSYDQYPSNSQNMNYDSTCCHCNRNNSGNSSSYSSDSNYLSDSSYFSDTGYSSSSSNYRVDNFYNPTEGFAKGNMQSNLYQPYKLNNPTLPQPSNDRERMLLEVQKYGFAMWDLNLYLNTHSTDRNAMMMFDRYRQAYRQAVNDYENKYGSLTVEQTNTSKSYWPWNESPWPWEVR